MSDRPVVALLGGFGANLLMFDQQPRPCGTIAVRTRPVISDGDRPPSREPIGRGRSEARARGPGAGRPARAAGRVRRATRSAAVAWGTTRRRRRPGRRPRRSSPCRRPRGRYSSRSIACPSGPIRCSASASSVTVCAVRSTSGWAATYSSRWDAGSAARIALPSAVAWAPSCIGTQRSTRAGARAVDDVGDADLAAVLVEEPQVGRPCRACRAALAGWVGRGSGSAGRAGGRRAHRTGSRARSRRRGARGSPRTRASAAGGTSSGAEGRRGRRGPWPTPVRTPPPTSSRRRTARCTELISVGPVPAIGPPSRRPTDASEQRTRRARSGTAGTWSRWGR